MDESDRGYRPELHYYGSAVAGDRRLEIVSGKVYSAAHPTYVTRVFPPSARSPDPPIPRRAVAYKSRGGGAKSSAWCFGDPEMKRRRRVASYKAYSVEGKVKASFRKGFRWIKNKCSELVNGF